MSIEGLDPATPGSDDNAGLGDDHIRALKVALQACFPALEGPIENTPASGDPGDINPPDAATFSGLFTRISNLETLLNTSGVVPVGMCMVWPSTDPIPAGWAPCDGGVYNGIGVPNYQGRFVLGADGTYPVNARGGVTDGGDTVAGGGSGGGVTGETQLSLGQIPDVASALNLKIADSTQADSHNNTFNVARGSVAGTSEQGALITGTGMNGAGHSHTLPSGSDHTHSVGFPLYEAAQWLCYVGV